MRLCPLSLIGIDPKFGLSMRVIVDLILGFISCMYYPLGTSSNLHALHIVSVGLSVNVDKSSLLYLMVLPEFSFFPKLKWFILLNCNFIVDASVKETERLVIFMNQSSDNDQIFNQSNLQIQNVDLWTNLFWILICLFQGSHGFVKSSKWIDTVAVFINIEASGSGGPGMF